MPIDSAFKRLSTSEPEVIRDCPSPNIKRNRPRQAYSKPYTAPYFKDTAGKAVLWCLPLQLKRETVWLPEFRSNFALNYRHWLLEVGPLT
jgi:hypothetical protein